MEDDYNECPHYWVSMLLQSDEPQIFLNETLSAYKDASSDHGTAETSMAAKKSVDSQRNRRKELAERLIALRAAVPKITKLDKESIIKDSIDYILKLQEEERKIQAEISDLEAAGPSSSTSNIIGFGHHHQNATSWQNLPTNFLDYSGTGLSSFPIEVLELKVKNMGEKTVVISLACSKRIDIMLLHHMFESLNLNIINVNLTSFQDRVLNTIFVQVHVDGEEEKDVLKKKIETAIAALNGQQNPRG